MKILCDTCDLQGFCSVQSATYPSIDTIKDPAVRLECQNFMVGMAMSADRLIDWMIDSQRDFLGWYKDEDGQVIGAPGIACWLTPGAVYWMRDQLEGGKWASVDAVPRLRRESVGRWRFAEMCRRMAQTVHPPCHRN